VEGTHRCIQTSNPMEPRVLVSPTTALYAHSSRTFQWRLPAQLQRQQQPAEMLVQRRDEAFDPGFE
jgi:hypothetical protein